MSGAAAGSDRRLDRLVGLAVWLLAGAYLLHVAFRGWIPHDEGLLGQLAARVLAGEWPHRDFDDPYSGGLSWLYAGAFTLLGERLTSLRVALLIATLAVVPLFYGLARRSAGPWSAALVTLVALAWGPPAYFAGLPSWYNLLLAVVATWAFVRHLETGRPGARTRWLLTAGLCAGFSCLAKVTGLYLLAALLLGAVFVRQEEEARDGGPRLGNGYPWLVTLGALGFAAVLLALVRPALGPSGGASGAGDVSRTSAVLFYFVLPGAVLGGLLALRAWRLRGALVPAVRGHATRLAPIVLGWGLPVVAWVLIYAMAGGLDALVRGVFVLPRLRFAYAAYPLPPLTALLAMAPILALLLWPRALGRRAQLALAGLVAATLGWAVAAAGSDEVIYRALWSPLRALVPMAVLVGVWPWLRSTANDRAGDADAGTERSRRFVLLAVLAMVSLIQFPDAFGIYFFYTAPVLVLALHGLAHARTEVPRAVLGVVAAAALVFALTWLHRGAPGAQGIRWRPAGNDTVLALPRGGLTVPRAEAALHRALVATIWQHARPGDPIFAGPDCPEVYFLAGMRNPTRSFFDFFDPTALDESALPDQLRAAGVRVVVINTRPVFSPLLSEALVRRLMERYPNQERVGGYLVLSAG